jgi:hypothetical protein
MSPTLSGHGYWLVASDGGVFAYGAARFHGSAGNLRLTKPIVGMALDRSGGGYWLAARDGVIFTYGYAPFFGCVGAFGTESPYVAIAATHD